jgi:hypothetical protein
MVILVAMALQQVLLEAVRIDHTITPLHIITLYYLETAGVILPLIRGIIPRVVLSTVSRPDSHLTDHITDHITGIGSLRVFGTIDKELRYN